MSPAPVLVLAALAAGAAAALEAQGTPGHAQTALLVIAGVLLAAVVLPALGRRWPDEPPPATRRNPHGTRLPDLAQTPDQLAAIPRQTTGR